MVIMSKKFTLSGCLRAGTAITALFLSNFAAAQYCTTSYPSGCGSWGISQVIIGGTSHNPACGSNNYTSTVFTLNAGAATSGSIVSQGWCGVGVAADFNNDFDFTDPGEALALPAYIGNAPATYNVTITVPSYVPSGNYRMRIWGRDGNSGGTNNSDPCGGGYSYGRFADYTLTVVNNASCFTPSGVSAVPAVTTASLSWMTSASNPATYRWKVVASGADPVTDPGVATGMTANTSDMASGLSPSTGYQLYVKSLCGASDSSVWSAPYSFTTGCSGPPVSGTASSSAASVCPGASFNLVLTGAGLGPGITYQWQSSTAGANTFTAIPGASGTTYAATQSEAKDYRCIVKCTTSNDSVMTNIVTVTMNPFLNCYCTPTYTSCSNDNIATVTLGSLSDAGQTCSPTYADRSPAQTGASPTLQVPSLTAGQNSTLTVTFGSDGSQYNGVWIDFNHSGTFEASEFFSTNSNAGSNGTANITLAVPASAMAGQTKMRIRGGDDNQPGSSQACGSAFWGTARDYLVNIVQLMAPPDCITAPAAPTDGAGVCMTTAATTLSWPASATASGYDVYLDNGAAATSLVATVSTTTYTTAAPLTAGDYAWKVVPKNSIGDASGCATFTFTVHALPAVSVTPPSGVFCSSGSATLTASGATTYAWSPATGLSAASGEVVTANPAVNTTYTVTGTDNNGCTNTAMAMVGPISNFSPEAPPQTLCGNTSAMIDVTPVAANSGSMEYELRDTAGTVLAPWQAGTSFTVMPAVTGVNNYLIFARITDCPSDLSDTGYVQVISGFTATVNATDASCVNGDGSLQVIDPQGPGAYGSLSWYSNDFSMAVLPDTNAAALRGVAVITGNALRLTPNLTSQAGGLLVKNPSGISSNVDSVIFTMSVPTNGADGMSWSFADNIVYNGGSQLEAGTGNKLIVSFDSYGSGNPGANGIYLTYGQAGGTSISSVVTATMLAYSNNTSWRGASGTPIAIYITDDGKLSLKVGSTMVFNQVQLPAAYLAADRSNWQHLFAARTGGISEQHVIDNLNIYYSGTSYVYGSAPANSNTVPATWQSSNTFTGLTGGDSLDIWIADPSDPSGCNQKLGTYGVSGPLVTSVLESSSPSCVNNNDGYIALQVNSAGTYSITYTPDGGSPVTLTGIVSQNNGTLDYVVISDLPAGNYTDLEITSSGGCVSNTISGPVVIADPGLTSIAASSTTVTNTQADSMQYYTDALCGAMAAINTANDLGSVTVSVSVNTTPASSPGNEPFLGRHYEITPSMNAGLPATLTLYFTQSDFDNYNASPMAGSTTYPLIDAGGTNLRVRAYHGSPSSGTTGPNGTYDDATSDILAPSSVVWNSNGFWEVTFSSPNGFSGFFANTNTGTPLALRIKDFKATNKGNANLLSWTSLDERNGDHFELERSADARHFVQLETIPAHGIPSTYAYTDKLPLSGTNYYRLLLTGADGTRYYSEIVAVGAEEQLFSITAYPNPVQERLHLRVTAAQGKGLFRVTDVTGRVMISQAVVRSGMQVLDLKHLPSGMYMLQYQDDAHTASLKINKQ